MITRNCFEAKLSHRSDLLVETEEREAKPRWLDCVKALQNARQQAVIVTELMKNPQAQWQNVFSTVKTNQDYSLWQKFLCMD